MSLGYSVLPASQRGCQVRWYGRVVQTLIYLLLLYLKYSLTVLALGIVVAGGLWFWLGLASFARRAREDL
jgi:hypothetical protein